MSLTSSVFSILLLSGDADIQSQFKHAFKDASVTAAKYASTLPKDVTRRTFDAVIVELKSRLIRWSRRHTHQHRSHTHIGNHRFSNCAETSLQVHASDGAAECCGSERKRSPIP